MGAKILEKIAIELESAKTSDRGWGVATAPMTLGEYDQIPFLSFGKGITVNSAEDNGILSEGFQDVPVQVGKYVEKSISMNAQFEGLNKLWFWLFGFEKVYKVTCFVVNTVSVEPVAGATYEDVASVVYTFLRKEVYKSDTFYVFSTLSSPISQTGNLTKTSGTGDSTLTFSAHSGTVNEHNFEFDPHERHLTDFRTAEQITGWSSGYKKNRMMTIGCKTSVTDLRYPNSMCKKFSFKSGAGQISTMDFDFCAYNESRGDYSSSTWTPINPFILNNALMAHHNLRFKVGASDSTLVNLGVTDISWDTEIPLEIIQDTESGLYLAEPKFEGKYKFSLEAKLSRYSAETYQTYRDSWTNLVAAIEAQRGYDKVLIMFNRVKLSGAGPDSDNVTKEPLKFEIGYEESNNWTSQLQNAPINTYCPVKAIIRNSEPDNMLFVN